MEIAQQSNGNSERAKEIIHTKKSFVKQILQNIIFEHEKILTLGSEGINRRIRKSCRPQKKSQDKLLWIKTNTHKNRKDNGDQDPNSDFS